MNSYYEGNYMN